MNSNYYVTVKSNNRTGKVSMASIRDVARRAGVGVGTVSRVINGNGYVSADTKKKIEKAIEELEYTPNELARNLFRNKTGIVGILVPDVDHPFFSSYVRQTEAALYELGYKNLIEAAAIDGCRPAGTFFKIVMPISKTVYATVFILDFVAHWNDFMWPFLVMTGEDKRTIQLAVQSFFGTQPVHYSAIMAALVISAIPMIIMFIFMQKYYVEGIASSGIKG